MAAKFGEKGWTKGKIKTGGRKKGSLNKNNANIQAKLERIGVDPIKGLARIGLAAERKGDHHLAVVCYKTLAEYVEPKKKSIEVTGQGGQELAFSWTPVQRALESAVVEDEKESAAGMLPATIDGESITYDD